MPVELPLILYRLSWLIDFGRSPQIPVSPNNRITKYG